MTVPRPKLRQEWFKSSYSSANGSCVEVRFSRDQVLIRESKLRARSSQRPVITVPFYDWADFLADLNGEQYRLPARLRVETTRSGMSIVDTRTGRTLSYSSAEWYTFIDGVRDGEFDPPQSPSEQIEAARIQARAAITAASIGTIAIVAGLVLQHLLQ